MIDNSRQLRAREEMGEEREGGHGPRPSTWASMKEKLAKTVAAVAIGGLALAGARCTYDVPPLNSNDSGMDASVNDGGPDADAGPVQDAGPDADAGPIHDGGDGGGPIDGGDGGGPVDAGDGGTDAGGIVCGAVTTGTWSGIINNVTPQTVVGYTFGFGGVDGSGNALMTISCTEGTFETSFPCAVGVETDVARPSDGVAPAGRTIKITPSSANATNTQVFIQITHP